MKHLTKSGLATTLQIAAILIMFGYPGCSADKMNKEPVSVIPAPVVGDTPAQLKSNLFEPGKGFQKWVLLKQ